MEQASACAARSSLSEWRTANIEDIDSPRRACTNLSRRSGKSVAGHGSSTRPLPPSSANRRGDGLGPGRSHIQDAFLDSAVGRRVASTLWLPQLLLAGASQRPRSACQARSLAARVPRQSAPRHVDNSNTRRSPPVQYATLVPTSLKHRNVAVGFHQASPHTAGGGRRNCLGPGCFYVDDRCIAAGTYAPRRIYDPSDGICHCRRFYRRVASLLAGYVRLGRSRVVGNVDDDPIHQPNGVSRYASAACEA